MWTVCYCPPKRAGLGQWMSVGESVAFFIDQSESRLFRLTNKRAGRCRWTNQRAGRVDGPIGEQVVLDGPIREQNKKTDQSEFLFEFHHGMTDQSGCTGRVCVDTS